MREFTDTSGQTWAIELNVASVRRIRQESEGRFLLLAPDEPFDGTDNPLVAVLHNDLEEFFELLWHLLSRQRKARGIEDSEEFAKLLGGEAIRTARKLFMEEWTDFFRDLGQPGHAWTVEQLSARQAEMEAEILARLNSPELKQTEERMREGFTKKMNSSFTEVLASADAILADVLGEK